MINTLIIDSDYRTWYWISHCNTDNSINIYFSKQYSSFREIIYYQPDIIVINTESQPTSSLELIKNIKNRKLSCRILALLGIADPKAILKLYNLGVEGIMDITCSFCPIEAIKTIYVSSYIQPNLCSDLLDYLQNDFDANEFMLTERENVVLTKSIQGKKCEIIANELFISRRTVTEARRNILKKLNVKSFKQLQTYLKQNDSSQNHDNSKDPIRAEQNKSRETQHAI